MRIVILHSAVHGDTPDARDTLFQAQAVGDVLRAKDHVVQTLSFGEAPRRVARELLDARPDLVFNLTEDVLGSARFIHLAPALLEELHIPFTGASSTALETSTSKALAKEILEAAGLPTPAWHARGRRPAFGGSFRPGLHIIKSVTEHASIGLDETSVRQLATADEVHAILAGQPDGEWFVERFVDGREFNISVLETASGPTVLPPAEIVFEDFGDRPRIVDYKAKWDENSHGYRHTPRRFDFPAADVFLLTELEGLALATWQAFGLGGYARIDFRVDAGGPQIIDVNANPCLAPDAGLAAAADRYGLDYAALVMEIAQCVQRPGKTGSRRPPSSRANAPLVACP